MVGRSFVGGVVVFGIAVSVGIFVSVFMIGHSFVGSVIVVFGVAVGAVAVVCLCVVIIISVGVGVVMLWIRILVRSSRQGNV